MCTILKNLLVKQQYHNLASTLCIEVLYKMSYEWETPPWSWLQPQSPGDPLEVHPVSGKVYEAHYRSPHRIY